LRRDGSKPTPLANVLTKQYSPPYLQRAAGGVRLTVVVYRNPSIDNKEVLWSNHDIARARDRGKRQALFLVLDLDAPHIEGRNEVWRTRHLCMSALRPTGYTVRKLATDNGHN